jgi:transposase-like protein
MPSKIKIKTKTIPTDLSDFQEILPYCPRCSSNKSVHKAGTKKLKSQTVQRYLCKSCNHRFTNRTIPNTPYPTTLILHALTYFNLGHTLAQTQATMKRKYKAKIPISTLNNWVSRFEDELTFIRLRKKFDIDPNL